MIRQSTEKKPLLRSCDQCRASKIRCMPDDHSDDKCQRCYRLQKECVFSEARGRPKKVISSKGKVAELEKKIEHLSSLLETPSATQASPSGPSTQTTSQTLPDYQATFQGNLNQLPDSTIPQLQPSVSGNLSTYTRTASSTGLDDVVEKGFLSLEMAHGLLESFRRDMDGFPFLIIPPLGINQFRWQRPCLLLAILIAASRDNFLLQEPLDSEFRTALSQKVMIEGSRSLDLIQGVVLYVAWYYHRFKVPDKQLYMLVQLAATMALELDLDKLSHSNVESPTNAESKRTLIAVYYLSSCTSMILRKPISMKHSYKLWDCCRSLAAAKIAPTDAYLIHYVHLQGLAEEIAETFGYSDGISPNTSTIGGIEGVEFRVNTYQRRLDQLRISIPTDGVASASLGPRYDVGVPHIGVVPASLSFTCDSISVYLHEVCLHIPAVTKPSLASGHGHVMSPESISSLSNLLWACLDAIKKLLNHFLHLTPAQIAVQTTIERGRVAHATVVLIKLSFAHIPGMDGFPLQQACNVSQTLEDLALKVGSVSSTPEDSTEQPDSYGQFRNTTRMVKSWYERVASTATVGFAPTTDEIPGMSPWKLVDLAKEESIFNFFLWRDDMDIETIFPPHGSS